MIESWTATDLAPLERAERRFEEVRRIYLSYLVVSAVAFLWIVAIVLTSGPTSFYERAYGKDVYDAVMRDDPDFEPTSVFLTSVAIFMPLALALLAAGLAAGRWSTIAIALVALLVYAVLFAWHGPFMTPSTAFPLLDPSAAFGVPSWAWAFALAQRLILSLITGSLAVTALLAIWSALRLRKRDFAIVRVARHGWLFSLDRFLAVFGVPLIFARRAPGRWLRIVIIALGVLLLSISAGFLFAAPGIEALTDVEYIPSCLSREGDLRIGACIGVQMAESALLNIIYYVGGALGFALAGALLLNAVRRIAPPRKLKDTRAPIVFLRSFKDDTSRLRPSLGGPLSFLLNFGRSPDSVDQLLIYEFSGRGPIVALGKPGEKHPPFGAERIYSDHADWQARILALMEEAQAIVLVADETPGLRWEIEQCLTNARFAEKTLFLFRSADDTASVGARMPPSPSNLIGAFRRNGGWNALQSRSKTRATFQIAARVFFEGAEA